MPAYADTLPMLSKPEPVRVSTKPVREYYTKLYNAYMAKVDKGEVDCNGHTFNQLVRIPTDEFLIDFLKKNNCKQF